MLGVSYAILILTSPPSSQMSPEGDSDQLRVSVTEKLP